MIDLAADIDEILSTDDFAEAVVFDLAGTPLTVNAIFTEPTEGVSFGGMEVEAQAPTLMVKTSEIENVAPGHEVTVRTVDYTVERITNVGTGMSVVYLKTQP